MAGEDIIVKRQYVRTLYILTALAFPLTMTSSELYHYPFSLPFISTYSLIMDFSSSVISTN